MKTVVTGAAGFIGANLVRRLIKDSREIRAIDNVSRGSNKNLADLPIETVHADLRSYEQTFQALEGADSVYHLAARVGIIDYLHGGKKAELDALQSKVSTAPNAEIAGAPKPNILLSIVIASYTLTRLHDLMELINSIAKQENFGFLEIVLVVETDKNLFDIMSSYLFETFKTGFKILYYPELEGMSDARNKGAQAACGRFIAFLDDDVVLNDGWFSNVIAIMEKLKATAATGPSYPFWIGATLDWFPKELSWLIGSTEWFTSKEVRMIRNVWGNNMIVKREDFLQVGGFTTQYGLHSASRRRWFDPPSEDVDLSFRLRERFGRSIIYVPSLGVRHKVTKTKLSWKSIAQRSYSVGYQRYAIRKLYSLKEESDLLSLEGDLMPSLLSLLPRSFLIAFKSPKKAMNIAATLFIALTFSMLGYIDRRPYYTAGQRHESDM